MQRTIKYNYVLICLTTSFHTYLIWFFLGNTENILNNILVTEQLWLPLFSILMDKKKHLDIYQNILFYVPQKKVSHTSLEWH